MNAREKVALLIKKWSAEVRDLNNRISVGEYTGRHGVIELSIRRDALKSCVSELKKANKDY
jgi:hypothetical protein